MSTLADRVWYALHCLPRDSKDRPPDMRTVERSAGLSNGTLSTTVRGIKTEPRSATYAKLAKVLCVDRDWLENGIGSPPALTGPLPPRPGYEIKAAWEPGAEAPPPGTEAIAAWRPDSSSQVHRASKGHKTTSTSHASHASPQSDDRPDSCPSRGIVVAMVRAQGYAEAGSRGIAEGAIAALLAERRNGDDPGEDYWVARLKKHIETAKSIQSVLSGTDK